MSTSRLRHTEATMGEAEAATVRRYYAAWSRGDLPAMLTEAHPDIDARPTLGVLYDHSVYSGHAGITTWFEEVAGRWRDFDPHVEETREHAGEVIAFIRLSAQRERGPVDARIAVFHSFVDGRIATLLGRDYWEVREEVGLPGR